MKRLIVICTVAVLAAFAGQAGATTYYNVGEWGLGPLEPEFVSWNWDYVKKDAPEWYRIVQINWKVENKGSITYYIPEFGRLHVWLN